MLDPANYRGIVLTSIVGKLFERVLLARLRRWVKAVGALPSLQAVPDGTTTDHLATLTELLALRKARGVPTWIMTVDIVKAYPSTCRLLLWDRLRRLGLQGALLRLLVSLFENSVRAGTSRGRYTDPIARATGVPEGFVLSPLLFALAFSPVVEALEATGRGVHVGAQWLGALLFMDDVALVADSREDLRVLATALWRWCWRFRFSPYPGRPKTFVFVVGPRAAAAVRDGGGDFVFHPAPQGGWDVPAPGP